MMKFWKWGRADLLGQLALLHASCSKQLCRKHRAKIGDVHHSRLSGRASSGSSRPAVPDRGGLVTNGCGLYPIVVLSTTPTLAWGGGGPPPPLETISGVEAARGCQAWKPAVSRQGTPGSSWSGQLKMELRLFLEAEEITRRGCYSSRQAYIYTAYPASASPLGTRT